MSKGKRDQRRRRYSTKPCPESQNGGCGYCVTGDYKTAARRRTRRIAQRDMRHPTD